MRPRLILLCASLAAGHASWTAAAQMGVEVMLPALQVHATGDKNVFATPFDYQDGMVFTVHVERSNGNGRDGINLQTVVRKGIRQQDATWRWESHVIESRTILDTFHTQASIAVDRIGFVHVAYNMHNMPWQYAVSAKPFDISAFVFKGQPITQADIASVKFENKTPFPDVGSAAIPGNQITYPMFFKDKTGELYVTYRFAVKPARSWERRGFAGGIARYDIANLQWTQIGGDVTIDNMDARLPPNQQAAIQKPFAYEDGYTVYLPTLGFDNKNGMHVFWSWREKEAGQDTTKPSYAVSADGTHFSDERGNPITLPINFMRSSPISRAADGRRYYAPMSVAITASGAPMVVVQPLTGGRELWMLDKQGQRFSTEPLPSGAPTIVVDKQDRQWAFATGLKVFMRPNANVQWEEIGQIGNDMCDPKVQYFRAESRFVVHAKSCDGKAAHILSFRR